MNYYNTHTHQYSARENEVSIVNCKLPESLDEIVIFPPYCSFGIHPWFINNIEIQLQQLESVLQLPETTALGEVGLDKLSHTSLDIQKQVFRRQIELSETYKKPLIIHCVKAWSELLAMKKEINPQMKWIVHGFRGNADLAKQLIQHDIRLSFGFRFNPKAVLQAWPHFLLAETDDKDIDIQMVYHQLYKSLQLEKEVFMLQLTENNKDIFCFR
ncbi:TatD family hydrolase [Parabacteroides sp. OttesenSCG-928-G07]|nr:TatD family hydrolase [Parabacteroides sp. OttesenSCG-928-G07]